MIAPLNGEVCFSDGLVIRARSPIWELPLQPKLLSKPHLGWVYFAAGRHRSDHGEFEVELACSEGHALAVFLIVLWSVDSFFGMPVPDDRERAVFHESLLARDLHGQREFSWGEAFCKFNRAESRNCLNIVYTAGPKVPAVPPAGLGVLWERKSPENSPPHHQSFTRPGEHPLHETLDLADHDRSGPARSGPGRAGTSRSIIP